MFPTIEKACEKAAEQEKSIYDRAKTRTIYANLAAHLVKSLREQNKKPSTATAATASTSTSKSVVATKYNLKTATTVVNKNSLKLVNKEVVPKVAYSHEAILAGAAAAKVSYSINRKKTLTLKDLNRKLCFNSPFVRRFKGFV
jgi:ElonginA binding-protein 1